MKRLIPLILCLGVVAGCDTVEKYIPEDGGKTPETVTNPTMDIPRICYAADAFDTGPTLDIPLPTTPCEGNP